LGPDFEKVKGKIAFVVWALYGLKSAGARVCTLTKRPILHAIWAIFAQSRAHAYNKF
jgi:hypothetical protein